MAEKGPLDRLRRSEARAKKILARNPSCGALAEASIACVLGELLARLWDGSVGGELAELNALAGVIQRLIAGEQQVLELRARLEEMAPMAADDPGCGLSEETLVNLEECLKLL